MKDNLQKMELIQEKIKQLKFEHNKIEQELIDMLTHVLRIKEGFQINFDAMIGGILEIIDTIRSDPVKMEAWRLMGSKFCKAKISKRRNIKKTNKQMETKYD